MQLNEQQMKMLKKALEYAEQYMSNVIHVNEPAILALPAKNRDPYEVNAMRLCREYIQDFQELDKFLGQELQHQQDILQSTMKTFEEKVPVQASCTLCGEERSLTVCEQCKNILQTERQDPKRTNLSLEDEVYLLRAHYEKLRPILTALRDMYIPNEFVSRKEVSEQLVEFLNRWGDFTDNAELL